MRSKTIYLLTSLYFLTFHPAGGVALKESLAVEESQSTKKNVPEGMAPADRVTQILQQFSSLSDRRKQGQVAPATAARLSGSEVNAYLRQELQSQPVEGLKSLEIKFLGANVLGAASVIDFDQVAVGDSSFAVRSMKSLISGKKQIYLEGVVTSGEGVARIKLQKAEMGSLSLPIPFVEMIVNYVGQGQDPPVDLSKPSPLPHGVREIEIGKGYLILRN